MPEQLFQAHFTPMQTHGEANAFARAGLGLSSPVCNGHTIPALGGGRHKPLAVPAPGGFPNSLPSQEQSKQPCHGSAAGQELDKHPEEEHHCVNLSLNSLS